MRLLSSDDNLIMTKEILEKMTPHDALEHLKNGNQPFAQVKTLQRDLLHEVKATSEGQYPFAAIVGCSDSRAPLELLFDQGVGDIFAARIAGNFVNADIIGSLEFAAKKIGSKVIVILGHDSCGAVKGVIDNVVMGNLTNALSRITPALRSVTGFSENLTSSNVEYVNAVAQKNVEMTVEAVLSRSVIINDLVRSGELMVIGAFYSVEKGEVTFYE